MSQSQEVVQNLGEPLMSWLKECVQRVNNNTAAAEMWNTLLTRDQQIELGDDLPTAWQSHGGTIRLWRHLQRMETLELAAVDLARRLHLIADHRAARLAEVLGGHASLPLGNRPQWDRVAGQIRFRGHVIRTVKMHQTRSNVEIILDAFETAGWPPQIPAPRGFDRDKLRDTLRSLNEGLADIRFGQQGGGTKVRWQTAGS